MGGADPLGLTQTVVEAISGVDRPDIHWDIVLGPASAIDKREVGPASGFQRQDSPPPHSEQFYFHDGATLGRDGFLSMLSESDIVVSNGGTTLYESLALGRPTISVPQNEFESAVVDQLAGVGACMKGDIAKAIMELLNDQKRRAGLSDKGSSLIDGKGCERLAGLILSRI